LIRLAKETAPGLLVSASGYGDGKVHTEVAEASDYLLPHWNGTTVGQIPERIAVLRRFGKPIVCNEDDKTGANAVAALRASVANGASYGLMLKEHNQTFPFHFDGAADDPVFYAELRALTAPASRPSAAVTTAPFWGRFETAVTNARAYTAPVLFVAGNERHRRLWGDRFFGRTPKVCMRKVTETTAIRAAWRGTAAKPLRHPASGLACLVLVCSCLVTDLPSALAGGPLRVHPDNPRYFTDGTKASDGSLKAVYLTGSHPWNNLQDSGKLGKPLTERFDYDSYLSRMARLNHNLIRVWAWEVGENDWYYDPAPWVRTGPGTGTDGRPKFDLKEFNPEYFERLRSRVMRCSI